MKFSEVARNLRNEGMKFAWGVQALITKPVEWYNAMNEEPKPIAYCAMGIKAVEFGVPNVTLAYFDYGNENPTRLSHALRTYVSFTGVIDVTTANDSSRNREGVATKLEELEGEADVEGFIEYLKTLTPYAIEWAKKNGYNSLLVDLPTDKA